MRLSPEEAETLARETFAQCGPPVRGYITFHMSETALDLKFDGAWRRWTEASQRTRRKEMTRALTATDAARPYVRRPAHGEITVETTRTADAFVSRYTMWVDPRKLGPAHA